MHQGSAHVSDVIPDGAKIWQILSSCTACDTCSHFRMLPTRLTQLITVHIDMHYMLRYAHTHTKHQHISTCTYAYLLQCQHLQSHRGALHPVHTLLAPPAHKLPSGPSQVPVRVSETHTYSHPDQPIHVHTYAMFTHMCTHSLLYQLTGTCKSLTN